MTDTILNTEKCIIMPNKVIQKWEPDAFSLEETSVWSFPDRGDWATHDSKWRGNWSPYIPRNIILRYSTEGELLLDQFAGGGTTLVEAKLLCRNIIGVDVNKTALLRCREKTMFTHKRADGTVYLRWGDARNLNFIPKESIDLICTHPPYANIIRYSEDIPDDLSRLSIPSFLEEMRRVAQESFRVLKPHRYCAVLMGDLRKKGHVIPLGFEVMRLFNEVGFNTKEIILKEQHNCRSTGYWQSNSSRKNFLLLAHEYLFVFDK